MEKEEEAGRKGEEGKRRDVKEEDNAGRSNRRGKREGRGRE